MIGKRDVNEWFRLIETRDVGLIFRLTSIYGENKELLEERLRALLNTAARFKKVYGNREISFVRAPGRLNTLGMHIDHRGGFVNPMALDKEVIFCYSGRDDDCIRVQNMNPLYGERNFRITEEIPAAKLSTVDDWLAWTQEQTNKRKNAGINDDWGNKLKAVPVYLHVIYPDVPLLGFDAIVDSSLPPRIGLSSSSSIVVSIMEIMADINNISFDDQKFVRYCGVAEWYVGTRGGFGDQAAIKFGRLGMIIHLKTLPDLLIDSYLPFPQGYQIIIFDSGIVADKTGAAGQKFNEKTATYELGEIYLRKYMQEHHADIFQKIVRSRKSLDVDKKFYLADIDECLSQQQIYAFLESLPERISRKKLLDQLPDDAALLKRQFATHEEPEEGYKIRLVVTYGIAESKRSRMLKELLNQQSVNDFGLLMNVSHDGDSVSADLPRFDPEKDLHLQPGDYGCSVPEIDEMVNISLEAGAVGAQISGAGLGGSMMALVNTDHADAVIYAMQEKYYKPRNIVEKIISARPIQGAGMV